METEQRKKSLVELGNYIKQLRIKLGMSQDELAKKCGYTSRSTINKIELGINDIPQSKIYAIAKALGVTASELLSQAAPEPSNIASIETGNIYCVPVYESVVAGFGAHASNEVVSYIPVIIRNPYDVPNTLGIRVQGNSMYPKIEDGDLIVVCKQDYVESGEIGVVMLDGEDGVVKRIVYGDGWVELQSINPEYMPRRFEGEEILRLKIVGKVIGIYKEP